MTTCDLTISRTIDAPPEAIYDVWLDPAIAGGPWFGAKRTIINTEVDGLFYHLIEHEGKNWAHYGRFIALERGTRIEHTWVSEATQGLETIVSIAFLPKGASTDVVLTHAGVPDDKMGRQHEDGWTWMLNALGDHFRSR
jgi:uncharacterized protein YndB with AHSA1/START domain